MKLTCLVLTLATACATQPDSIDDEDFTDLAVLDQTSDAFTSRMTLLGTIEPGDTKGPIEAAASPRFRAFAFTASDGDIVTADVTSQDGDPVMWILDAGFHTLAKSTSVGGGNAAGVMLGMHGAPTHYLVFAEHAGNAAHFTVTYGRAHVNEGPVPTCLFGFDFTNSSLEKTITGTLQSHDATSCTATLDGTTSLGELPCNGSPSFPASQLGVGDHEVRVDASGPGGVGSCSAHVHIEAVPTCTVATNPPTGTTATEFGISFTTSSNAQDCTLAFDGGTPKLLPLGCFAPFTNTFTFAAGTHTVTMGVGNAGGGHGSCSTTVTVQ